MWFRFCPYDQCEYPFVRVYRPFRRTAPEGSCDARPLDLFITDQFPVAREGIHALGRLAVCCVIASPILFLILRSETAAKYSDLIGSAGSYRRVFMVQLRQQQLTRLVPCRAVPAVQNAQSEQSIRRNSVGLVFGIETIQPIADLLVFGWIA